MAGREPEETVRRPIVEQGWRDVTFLHWRYDASVVAKLLPDGLVPDEMDGSAWVSLTPFSVVGFRIPPAPPVPVLSNFPETNLRTYVRGPNGVDGLLFLSLDVESLPTTLGARLTLGVPYVWSDMKVENDGDRITYTCRRRGTARGHHRIVVRPGPPCGSSDLRELDHLLTGRWRAWTVAARRLAAVPVQHQPWPLHKVAVDELDETIVEAAGLPAPAGDPIAHWAPGVDARFGSPRRVRSATRPRPS